MQLSCFSLAIIFFFFFACQLELEILEADGGVSGDVFLLQRSPLLLPRFVLFFISQSHPSSPNGTDEEARTYVPGHAI
jgi:hypothetical protein